MKGFFQTAVTSFQMNSVYRANTILGIVLKLISICVPLFVWQALYASTNSSVINGRTLSDMFIYVLISKTCSAMMATDFAETIERRMRSGEIEYDFLRPLPARLVFVGENLGTSLYTLMITFVPSFILAVFLFPVSDVTVTGISILFFVCSLILGYMISALFELLKGMLAFWFVNIYILNWFMDFFSVLLSGAYVPLWFFPDWLRIVAKFLPFQAAYFLPVEIFLGIRNLDGCLTALFLQICWILILWLAQEFLWRKSVRKLTILGG